MSEDEAVSEANKTKQESSPSDSKDSVLNLAQSVNKMKDLLKRIVSQNNASQLQQSSGPKSRTERKGSSDSRRRNLSAICQQKRSENDVSACLQ